MKRLSISLFLIAALAANTFAGDKVSKDRDENVATYYVSSQFAISFPNAKNVIWTVTKQVQKADFILNNKKVTAFYDMDGTYMGISQTVNYSLVPIEAQAEIAKKYANYKVGEVIEYETPVEDEGYQKFNGREDTPIKFFVDLKNDNEEFLLKVTRSGFITFFQQIK